MKEHSHLGNGNSVEEEPEIQGTSPDGKIKFRKYRDDASQLDEDIRQSGIINTPVGVIYNRRKVMGEAEELAEELGITIVGDIPTPQLVLHLLNQVKERFIRRQE